MELMSMLLRMYIYNELYFFFFCALERNIFNYSIIRIIFIRKREATNYFRLMTPSVDESDSNELMPQRPVASLIDPAWFDWLPYSLRYKCLLIWLWETFLVMGKYFVRKLKYLRPGGSVDRKSFWIVLLWAKATKLLSQFKISSCVG